jgi:hypothetical protein
MSGTIPRRRFYVGSAAIFWFAVALLIWSFFFSSLSGAFPVDVDVASRWAVALYFSAPAVVAVVIRNLTAVGDSWRCAVLAWLVALLVFVLVGFVMVASISPFGGTLKAGLRAPLSRALCRAGLGVATVSLL